MVIVLLFIVNRDALARFDLFRCRSRASSTTATTNGDDSLIAVLLFGHSEPWASDFIYACLSPFVTCNVGLVSAPLRVYPREF